MHQCNGCTDCCILGTTIKPLGILCPEACGGCKIYDKRPTECRTFRCSCEGARGFRRGLRYSRATLV